MMNRNPKIGDLVFAPITGLGGDVYAVRGVVIHIDEDRLAISGPHTMIRCARKGAIVIPREAYTQEELEIVNQVRCRTKK